MGELDNWNDDRMAATLALAERIAGDLAVLVAGLRPEPPKPAPDDKVGHWFVRAHDCTDAVQCLRPTGVRGPNGENEYETTPCLAGRTVRYLLPKCWLPIPDRPGAAVLATRGKRLTGVVHVPEGREQFVSGDGGIHCAGGCIPERCLFAGRRWIAEDIPQPQPKFPVPTWAYHQNGELRIVKSAGDGIVAVFHPGGSRSAYSGTPESNWTACEDPLATVTAAMAKESA